MNTQTVMYWIWYKDRLAIRNLCLHNTCFKEPNCSIQNIIILNEYLIADQALQKEDPQMVIKKIYFKSEYKFIYIYAYIYITLPILSWESINLLHFG